MTRLPGAVWLVVGAVIGLGAAAHAQLSAPTITTTGTSCSPGNDTSGYCGFSTSTVSSSGSSFQTRYAWNVNADVGTGTRIQTGTAFHRLSSRPLRPPPIG